MTFQRYALAARFGATHVPTKDELRAHAERLDIFWRGHIQVLDSAICSEHMNGGTIIGGHPLRVFDPSAVVIL